MIISMVYPVLPPTSNKIYFRGTILRKEAREYAERFSYEMTRQYLPLFNQIDPMGIYSISLHFFFESLLNESYNNPKVPEKKRAKTRYKKLDLDNRVKLVADCTRDLLGVDDSHTFEMLTVKAVDKSNPRVEIYVRDVEPSWYGVG